MFGNHCWIIHFDLLVTREEKQGSCYNQRQIRFQSTGTRYNEQYFLFCIPSCSKFFLKPLYKAILFLSLWAATCSGILQYAVKAPAPSRHYDNVTDRTRSQDLNLPSDAYHLSSNGSWYILGSHIMNFPLCTDWDIFSSQVKGLQVWLRTFPSFKDNQWHIWNSGNE